MGESTTVPTWKTKIHEQQDVNYFAFFFFKSPATSVKTPTEQMRVTAA